MGKDWKTNNIMIYGYYVDVFNVSDFAFLSIYRWSILLLVLTVGFYEKVMKPSLCIALAGT
jgi:hypothetical protein